MHSAGYRYRVAYPVPGRPRRSIDVAFPRRKVAVLVDGCFWHGCPDHGTRPRANASWWNQKVETNRARDRDTDEALSEAGWQVVRVWEHEDPEEAVGRIASLLS